MCRHDNAAWTIKKAGMVKCRQKTNKHVYLVASALPGWSDACQMKSLSDTSCEPHLVRNYCAR
ncbi:hypothetical protein T12_9397 [Trichinella patagoniensis]|uniref:Uncharacterized protein n=1 Tax=Trichinella patagoniensis TaxID=990121 RepID=A0A0V0Z2S1_9BILA|nr:hypothetical protein T12_9397 [Trichinella patagoniensis]